MVPVLVEIHLIHVKHAAIFTARSLCVKLSDKKTPPLCYYTDKAKLSSDTKIICLSASNMKSYCSITSDTECFICSVISRAVKHAGRVEKKLTHKRVFHAQSSLSAFDCADTQIRNETFLPEQNTC